MHYRNVGIILSSTCNAACEICCFGCNPANNDVIEEALLLKCIQQIAEVPDIVAVPFSGGEVFLFPELLMAGVQAARAHNLHTVVATNGFWGKATGEEGFEEIVRYLSALKPDKLCISTDSYHGKFVPLQVAQNAIALSRKLVKITQVMIGETKNSVQAHEFIQAMDDRKYLMDFSIYPFLPAGKARMLPDHEFYRHYPKRNLFCGYDRIAAIRYDGEVFPCCNPFVFSGALSLGNVKDQPLRDILNKTKQNPLFVVLERLGFDWFVDIAENELGLRLPETFSSACELCHTLFGDKNKIEQFAPYLDQKYNQLLVDSLLNRRATA